MYYQRQATMSPEGPIIVKNDGFSPDVPLIALSVAGLLKGAHIGYSRGLQLDWKDALEDTRRERLRLPR